MAEIFRENVKSFDRKHHICGIFISLRHMMPEAEIQRDQITPVDKKHLVREIMLINRVKIQTTSVWFGFTFGLVWILHKK